MGSARLFDVTEFLIIAFLGAIKNEKSKAKLKNDHQNNFSFSDKVNKG